MDTIVILQIHKLLYMPDTIILTSMERKRERDWNVCVCVKERGGRSSHK